jgi:hypothetical protein
MALRHFRDSEGREWRVWDVVPYGGQLGERRRSERRAEDDAYAGPERRTGRERRLRTPSLLTPGLEAGWLCFENQLDKRRLTPIPMGWAEAPSGELEALLTRARAVDRRRN